MIPIPHTISNKHVIKNGNIIHNFKKNIIWKYDGRP
jgi:hypothetical protein